jgi:hypothetical protein
MPQTAAVAAPGVGAFAVDEAVAVDDDGAPVALPPGSGAGGVTAPGDQRVGDGGSESPLEAAFATFEDSEGLPGSNLFDPLATGRLTL